MLKKKYNYKLSPNEICILSNVIHQAFDYCSNTKDTSIQLALCVIIKVRNKLSINIFGRGDVKFSLNTAEALAFHMLYMKGIIIDNFLTNQIFTPIDKTL